MSHTHLRHQLRELKHCDYKKRLPESHGHAVVQHAQFLCDASYRFFYNEDHRTIAAASILGGLYLMRAHRSVLVQATSDLLSALSRPFHVLHGKHEEEPALLTSDALESIEAKLEQCTLTLVRAFVSGHVPPDLAKPMRKRYFYSYEDYRVLQMKMSRSASSPWSHFSSPILRVPPSAADHKRPIPPPNREAMARKRLFLSAELKDDIEEIKVPDTLWLNVSEDDEGWGSLVSGGSHLLSPPQDDGDDRSPQGGRRTPVYDDDDDEEDDKDGVDLMCDEFLNDDLNSLPYDEDIDENDLISYKNISGPPSAYNNRGGWGHASVGAPMSAKRPTPCSGPGYMGEDPPWARFVNPKAAWPSPTEKRSSSMMSEVRDLTADDLIEEQAREAKRFRHGYPSGTLHAAWME